MTALQNSYQNHHIIPKYRCKEIGIDPEFEGNVIRITRKEHADAHYQRWLKHKDPRDMLAAQVLARGEIDGIDTTGKNNPMYGKENKWGYHTEETKKKMSEVKMGKKHSEESKKKMSEVKMGKKHSEETKKKMSEVKSGKGNPFYGKKLTEEHKRKIGDGNRSKVHTEEHKRKISESMKGNPLTEEHKKNISIGMTGKKLTEEHKRKISESKKKILDKPQ